MSDADVLVFLHTQGALQSTWVDQEFARAHQLGLGILNIVWPGHSPTPGTDLGVMHYLSAADFAPGQPASVPEAMLTADALGRLAIAIESLRARAIADRRRRVISAFCRSVDAFIRRTGATTLKVVNVQPSGHLEVEKQGALAPIRVYPVVGHPDGHQARNAADACQVDGRKGYLLYDQNGLDAATTSHLRWLNGYLPVSSFSTNEVEEWLPRL
jgi:hypothetical protein